ncbi:MAG: LPS export ABC transporter periplasmic protein LptC [Sulfuricaulis sp.]|uniref:LPS export ABC transporter periplasmic protein LptC n=1 Tax=Sulfuricaulis sp. TaxID=2003553 RepID=UPI0025CDB3E6|nr:LPS export ABC transporter periplasmic protein LptC [Sulfuricaulis sp.]MCR4347051.1 LPS export ABC transporter periplasmic protein LptC [Sulfuricaulis sp.]
MILDSKRIAIAATLLLLATGSWWLTRTVTVPDKVFDGKLRHDPDYTIENFSVTVMGERGQRRYTLSAVNLIHYGDDGSSNLEQPYLIQYREGSVPVHTRADKGWMPKSRNEILLDGNAVSARGRDPRGAGGEIRVDRMKILLDR